VGFYAKHILPHVIDIAMRNPAATRLRGEWIPKVAGDVLEVGIGSGLNLPFYTDRVRRVYGLDPSPELQQMTRRRAADLHFPVEFMSQPAESAIPLPSGTIDTVVLTWTLCSVRDPQLALREVRRVMKPDSRLVFIEHGSAPDARVRNWQRRITPVWKRLAGGCHLNRSVDRILERAGLEICELKRDYIRGPRLLSYTFRGIARKPM
jgi:ubiquinone/menaquinone biosynthesis C-methylase UbiE